MPKSKPHYFFKVFFPDQSASHLRIPPAFWEHIRAESGNKVSLKGPSGSTWKVNLVKSSDGFIFEDGWKEFVADQSLVMGDFLLFRYDGYSRFKVLVFDSTACEKKKAFLVRPSRGEEMNVAEESEESEEEVSMGEEEEDNKPLVHFTKKRFYEIMKRKRGMAMNDPSKKKKKKDKQFQSDVDQSYSKSSKLNLRKATFKPEALIHLEDPTFSTILPLRRLNGRQVHPSLNPRALASPEGTRLGSDHDRAHLSRDLIIPKQECESYSPSSSSKSDGKKPIQKHWKSMHTDSTFSIRFRTINKKTKVHYHNGQVTTSSSHSIEKSTSKKSSKALECVESNEVAYRRPCEHLPLYTMATNAILRVGSLMSQRRPVTEEEVKRTLERAMSFKSEHPFAIAVMQDSYVYTSFFMCVPTWFAKEHLPKMSTVLTVWDPTGKPWKITYISYSTHGALSGGWGKFSYANNLEKYDACAFELIQKDQLKVHIYRVVEELTPLIRRRTSDADLW